MEKAAECSFASLQEGEQISFEVPITHKLVGSFAELSGDYSPLHVDQAYAAQTEFGQPVAHGMIIGALFSRLIGMHMPGAYALYLSQSLQFHQAVYEGTQLLIEGTIIQKVEALQIVKIRTIAYSLPGREVMVSGEALVKLLK